MNNISLLIAVSFIHITSLAQTDRQEDARTLAEDGKLREAVTVMDELISENAHRASYYRDKANYLLHLKDYEGSLNTLSAGIDAMPDSASLYDMRGTLMEAFGRYSEAISDFTMGLEKAEDTALRSHLLANRGGTKFRLRDYEGSYQDLITSVKLDSTNVDALNNLAAVCDEVGKSSETLRYLEAIISIDPDYVPAYVNIGFKYQKLGEHDNAIKYFNKAIEMDPGEPLAYSNRSFSKLKKNDLTGAMKDINIAISLMPRNAYAYKIRAMILIELGKLKDACQDLKQALELGYRQQYGDEVDDLMSKHCKY